MLNRMETGYQEDDGITQKQFMSTQHLLNTQYVAKSNDELHKDIDN